jgi:4-aminobutyrate aminotransferase-like enzyme
VLRDEALADGARQRGGQFISGLAKLAQRHDFVGEVRGRGLMIGVEIVRSKASRVPAADRAKRIQTEMRRRGVLLAVTGVNNCILRITPPLVITEGQIDNVLAAFEEVFAAEPAA